jgi:Tol biopolymer transport system component
VGFRIDLPIGTPNIHLAFTPDGNWLYFHDRDSGGKDALFRIPAAGGEPERMGEFPLHTVMGHMKISPDGRKVIVTDSPNNRNTARQDEMWLLENFEPKALAAK